ncbi:unnamed protein product [Closterium sp. NIES-53]
MGVGYLHDRGITVTFVGGGRTAVYTDAATGAVLATFTREHRSGLYDLNTEHNQVATVGATLRFAFGLLSSPLKLFEQELDLRKAVVEVLVAVEKPKLKANPVIPSCLPCNQVLAHLGMENIFDNYDLLEMMEGTEKRPENGPEKSP